MSRTIYYRCDDCKHIMEENEIETRSECLEGAFIGYLDVCCNCGCEDMTEGVKCIHCGRFIEFDRLKYGFPCEVCDMCLDKYSNMETCKDIGNRHPATVKINSFLDYMFTSQEIEDILFRELSQYTTIKSDCRGYLEDMAEDDSEIWEEVR